jgi:hypothetical protein
MTGIRSGQPDIGATLGRVSEFTLPAVRTGNVIVQWETSSPVLL